MLAFSFFIAVFSSLMWLIYMLNYLHDKLAGVAFSTLGLADLSVYVALITLPILVLWMIFGYVNQFLGFRSLNNNMYSLFKQMKKNQDYTDLVSRILLEAEQEIKDGFILNKFDLLIADMNELLAEVIQRSMLASAEQIERLWLKVQNGGKWAFGKVIIEVSLNQSNFSSRILNRTQTDKVLAGTILEFCARYQNMLVLLEKHDKERIFLNMIETGVYGKVYSILAPMADDIRHNRDVSTLRAQLEETTPEPQVKPEPQAVKPVPQPEREIPTPRYAPQRESRYPTVDENTRSSFLKMFSPFKRKEESEEIEDDYPSDEKDPFSLALEKSFSEPEPAEVSLTAQREELPDEPPQLQAPKMPEEEETEFFISAPTAENEDISLPRPIPRTEEEVAAPVICEEDKIGFTNTQKTLNSLKKEWEEMKIAESKPAVRKEPELTRDEDYAYPFGGWTDEENYRR